MDYTSRMVELLREMRRERNGAVADAMRYYGVAYGLNYGVSLPTLREIARTQGRDYDFARYLYLQDVRELRLAALYIAQPEYLTRKEFPVWAAGIVNSEVAEEAAFALLSRADTLPELFESWIQSDDPLLQYAALLAATRWRKPRAEWIASALDAVRRNAADVARQQQAADKSGTSGQAAANPTTACGENDGHTDASLKDAHSFRTDSVDAPLHTASYRAERAAHAADSMVDATTSAATSAGSAPDEKTSSAHTASPDHSHHDAEPCPTTLASLRAGKPIGAKTLLYPVPADHLTAQGAVALLAAIGAQNEENRLAVLRASGSLGHLPAEDFVHEELAWRLEA